ncbi:hypothetical protein FRB91_010682 [Serendipita sp. 411]|nr:hypothetical protein FRB91_010682 [Serendipita sp. 411]
MANIIQLLQFIKPLTGKDNWPSWKTDMKIVLAAKGSWKFVTGDEALPSDKKELEAIQIKPTMAALAIKLACSESACQLVEEKHSAIDIFATLKKQYEANTPAM